MSTSETIATLVLVGLLLVAFVPIVREEWLGRGVFRWGKWQKTGPAEVETADDRLSDRRRGGVGNAEANVAARVGGASTFPYDWAKEGL